MPHVVVVGGGFTGLAAAYELARAGVDVTLAESDPSLGGLAGSFDFGGQPLEKFYHHWFTSDLEIDALVREVGLDGRIVPHATQTGTYYANSFFRLSKPLDVLRYKALAFPDRLRLGLLVLAAKRVRDWRQLEHMTARDWLVSVCGDNVYTAVWKPLLEGKFGPYSDRISAVWMWNKLAARGLSRGRRGGEVLRYFEGGFAALADAIAQAIRCHGGSVRVGAPVTALEVDHGRITGAVVAGETLAADAVILTPALPIAADFLRPHVSQAYAESLGRIHYLGNVCLVLALSRSLSDYYWLNVSDPTFPFVGIIEHTNLEDTARYAGRHVVYLSKYLEPDTALYGMSERDYLDYALPYVRRIFPSFDAGTIEDYRLHRARYAQPVVVPGYQAMIPDHRSPLPGVWLATMAQVYPEDRGTNFAVRDGRKVARAVLQELGHRSSESFPPQRGA